MEEKILISKSYYHKLQVIENKYKAILVILGEDSKPFNTHLPKIVKTVRPASQQHDLEKFPSAGKGWEEVEERDLIKSFHKGKNVRELSDIFGRTKGSIRSRLKKLKLIEE